jgi:hypothetical protein
VCNEGYPSSLAAASLQRLGLRGATDLDGRYQAILAAKAGFTPEPSAGVLASWMSVTA